MAGTSDVVRVAAVADIHVTRKSQGAFQPLFSRINHDADVLVLAGDLTDYGLPEEAHILAEELSVVNLPIVAVLGNHDFESGKQTELHNILCEAGVMMLDGDSCEVHGVGFAGVKGFAGGFGRGCLEPWGEGVIKAFVQEAVNESLKLEAALARLSTARRVAVLHYAPIRETVEGEPLEILSFLGSRRLEEPLNRFPVHAIFHGHAHYGSLEGKTSGGVPVYNVAMPLLKKKVPASPPFRVVEIPREAPREAEEAEIASCPAEW